MWARLSPGGQHASAVGFDGPWEAGLNTAPTEGFPLKMYGSSQGLIYFLSGKGLFSYKENQENAYFE